MGDSIIPPLGASSQSNSIPDTSGPMMGNALLAFPFHFLHSIVQKEINKDSIELRLRMLPLDLPLQKLNAPDAAPSQLNLPRVTAVNHFLLPDVRFQWRAVLEAAEGVEHLGNPVVREHGDLINVVEVAEALALEAGPEVGYQDLCALVETDDGVLVFVTVVQAGKVVDEEVDEGGGGAFGLRNARRKLSFKAVPQDVASLS